MRGMPSDFGFKVVILSAVWRLNSGGGARRKRGGSPGGSYRRPVTTLACARWKPWTRRTADGLKVWWPDPGKNHGGPPTSGVSSRVGNGGTTATEPGGGSSPSRGFRLRFWTHWVRNAYRHLRGCFKETVGDVGLEM